MSLLDKLKGVPSDEFLAQAGHFLLAVSAVALPGWVGGDVAAKWGTGIVLGYALVKEIIWDPRMEENNAFFWEGAIDTAFFLLGCGVAWGARFLL